MERVRNRYLIMLNYPNIVPQYEDAVPNTQFMGGTGVLGNPVGRVQPVQENKWSFEGN